MADDRQKNRYGLTEDQIGIAATGEKAAVFPKLDVRGLRYERGEVSIYKLSKTQIVVVPAGVAWSPKKALEEFAPAWEKMQAAEKREAEKADVQAVPSVEVVTDGNAEASGKELPNESRGDAKRTSR